MSLMRHDLESRGRVSLLLVLLEVVVDFGNQMPNPVPLGVVWRQPWYPSVVVHQFACEWQFFLRQPWVSLLDPHIWIQPYFLWFKRLASWRIPYARVSREVAIRRCSGAALIKVPTWLSQATSDAPD